MSDCMDDEGSKPGLLGEVNVETGANAIRVHAPEKTGAVEWRRSGNEGRGAFDRTSRSSRWLVRPWLAGKGFK